MAATILIVDDEKDIRTSLKGILEDEGYQVMLAADGEEALESVRAELPDMVLLDIWMPGKDGLETLSILKEQFPFLTVVMISGHGTIETAVKATKLGAFDFVEKPLSLEKVLITVANALRIKQLSQENMELKKESCKKHDLIGSSQQIETLRGQVAKLGKHNSTVLISGEHGTGKALLAGAIHYKGILKENPFITIACSSMPEEVLEQELFGYEKGAFTGAVSRKKGALERADGGTLFLDEIAELAPATQTRLLRALQELSFERIGGSRCVNVSLRVIASTNRDISAEIAAGNFSQELYYHLAVVKLEMPPLRQHITDIPELAEHFICQFSKQEGVPPKKIHDSAMLLLQKYAWPGNVRELKNCIERMLILEDGSFITADTASELINNDMESFREPKSAISNGTFRTAREEFERDFIMQKLEENDWNISRTAELIDMERSNLHRKIKNYGIDGHKASL